MADAQDTDKPTEDQAAELDEEENERTLETIQHVDSDSGSLDDSDEEAEKPKVGTSASAWNRKKYLLFFLFVCLLLFY